MRVSWTYSLDKKQLDQAVLQVIELTHSSRADEANDIAEYQSSQSFQSGPTEADIDLMFKKLADFLNYCQAKFPKVHLRDVWFTFIKTKS